MAEANCERTPSADWVWIPLVEFIERKRAEVDSPELAERLARKDIMEWLHFRYLDRNGHQRYDRHLTDRFWREAKRDGSALIWTPGPILYDYSEPTHVDLRIESEPGIQLYKVEVLAPPSDVATLGQPKVGVSPPHAAEGGPLKLSGQRWIEVAYKRERERFIREHISITDAARMLAKESETTATKPMKAGYIKNQLRQYWHVPARKPSKQQPK